MFSNNLASSQKDQTNSVVTKLVESEFKINVNSIADSSVTTIKKLIAEAKEKNRAIIFTFTPGPFKAAEELPEGWMQTPEAVGCSAQLSAFDKEAKELNADIYAINKQGDAYQCGSVGLLAVKKLNNLKMISDENGELAKEFGLKTFNVSGKEYLARFSVVIKLNGESAIMQLSSPVNDLKAQEHVAAIKKFIGVGLDNQMSAGDVAPRAEFGFS